MPKAHSFATIEHWYASQCNGDWEHEFGIRIETLDNPGWFVEIDLVETEVQNATMNPVEFERTESDWIHCRIEDRKFKGFGGPLNLHEVIETFARFVDQGGKER